MKRFASALSLALVASLAHAQQNGPVEAETGSHVETARAARAPYSTKLSDTDAARVTLAEFARCTVDRQRGKLGTVLVGKVGAMTQLVDDNCLFSGQLKFKPLLMRGAVYTELVRRRARAGTLDRPWTLNVAPINRSDMSAETWGDAALSAMIDLADCVVTRDRAAAMKVVTTATASAEQNTAFEAITSHLGPCLYEGQKLDLSKPVLEGALAEVLYRGVAADPAAQEMVK